MWGACQRVIGTLQSVVQPNESPGRGERVIGTLQSVQLFILMSQGTGEPPRVIGTL